MPQNRTRFFIVKQSAKNLQAVPSQKSPSILGNPHAISSSNSGTKAQIQQQSQQQQLSKNMLQTQFFFHIRIPKRNLRTPLVRQVLLCSHCCSCGFYDTFNMVSVLLGFEEKDGDDVDEFVVGIRYNLGDKATNFPVWTVGEGLRVAKNSTFRLAMDEKLVLINNPNGIIVWSSNTSSLSVEKASLLDNGNLVLLGNKDEVIWRALVVQQTLYFLVSHSITLLALKDLR
ncbi:Receptor-like serine/threonine-protein kinase [Forsythia ovata]|uniref:Receptor-like serine/threonine-protein kinase n=1 Tax=Forsythia ovata TaxID=205694 RepID=A0ABD1UYP7_9LAMI